MKGDQLWEEEQRCIHGNLSDISAGEEDGCYDSQEVLRNGL